jgi:hypothetical protein
MNFQENADSQLAKLLEIQHYWPWDGRIDIICII